MVKRGPHRRRGLEWRLDRVQWLFNALGEASLPAVCVETRHMRAVT